ncbi:LysR substrate-binding domain-containing protein [Kluyvera cryocrescens]|uniref:LysR substrate-binding domain-containing protein n=1 Tax=Kluyvera cryocrescens TaxID=580 RepID=A0AAW9CAV0_KLUCR|nr:LysR substrate-binding domain-containing protein [Kluyvera cryocrescens]MDW3778922.1 LysR substrate-binding domain-containing protein [Kluyvera cryocrescens]
MQRSGLTELEVVLAVARQQSFRAAARELGLSATAVSNAVAGLEARLNVRLFNRTTRSVALTEQGRRYIARITPALAEIQRAAEEITAEPGVPTGTLRINAPRESVSLLFNLFDTYLQRYPQMKLDITTESRMIDIVAEGYDAGIRLAESVPQDMIASALTPEDLAAHQSIGMRMSHGGVYHWELERHQHKFTVNVPPRLIVSEMQVIHRAALAGLGLAFISQWFIQDDLANGKLISILDEWCPTFGGLRLYYPGHRHVLPALRAFIELAHELNTRQTLPR